MSHPLFEIVTTTAGAVSIRNKVVNEIMHNPVGPWAEANALYIEQSKLKERLLEPTQEELVVFDVGLGAAANSLAALACARQLGTASRPLRIVSFEKELELLRFALKHSSHFEHFKGYEEALQSLLEIGEWSGERLHWVLRPGDFLEAIEKESFQPHLVFFDPYSPKVNTEMWTQACFSKLRRLSREKEEGGTLLLTYSRATRIRTAMIAAGFFVGYGRATGLKDETTQAATDLSLLVEPLGQEWLERWRRSHVRYPFDTEASAEASIDQAIEAYFSKLL